MSNVSILMKFFGRKSGQSLQEFHAEIKQLSEQEKIELVDAILALQAGSQHAA